MGVCFLSIDRKDPSPLFLARFAGAKTSVKSVSAATNLDKWSEKEIPHRVIDKETREPGIILNTGKINWIEDSAVDVLGDYYVGKQGSEGYRYRVELKSERWVVTKSEELFSK